MTMLGKPKVLQWTKHAEAKMRQYGLSESRVRRVMHTPTRVEEGIAPDTIAMMQPASVRGMIGKESIWNQEIWVMLTETKAKRTVISAWRYPGVTKPGDPIPEEIMRELRSII